MIQVQNLSTRLLLVLALGAASAPGAIIFADNFNTPTPTFPLSTTVGGQILFTNATTTTPNTYGWFVQGTGIDHKASGVDATWPYQGADGGSFVDLSSSGPGGMQVILLSSVVPGTPYTLTFSSAAFGDPTSSRTLGVTVDDGFSTYVSDTITLTPTWNVTTGSWSNYSYTFTPNLVNVGLTFTSPDAGEFGALLDLVSLDGAAPPPPPTGVPEPGTLLLVGGALLGIAGMRLKKSGQN